VKSL
jgi:5-methylcytosine-specific restriction endonuclease McrA